MASRKQSKANGARRSAAPKNEKALAPAHPSLGVGVPYAVMYHRMCNDGKAGAYAAWVHLPPGVQKRLAEIYYEGANERKEHSAASYAEFCRLADQEGLPLFYPTHASEPPPDFLLSRPGRTVYYVDVCPRLDILRQLCSELAKIHGALVVIDHHESARQVLYELENVGAPAPGGPAGTSVSGSDGEPAVVAAHPAGGRHGVAAYFDAPPPASPEAGAQVAWRYFSGHHARGTPKPEPLFAKYIGDRDIWWKMGLPESEAVNEAFFAKKYQTFGDFDFLCSFEDVHGGEEFTRHFASIGRPFVEARRATVERIVAAARFAFVEVRLDDRTRRAYRVRVVNSPVYQSDIAHAICQAAADQPAGPRRADGKNGAPGKKIHFAAVWYYNHSKRQTQVSLRAGSPDVDLSWIAPRVVGALHGGGHPSAAGYVFRGSDIAAHFPTALDEGVAVAPFPRECPAPGVPSERPGLSPGGGGV